MRGKGVEVSDESDKDVSVIALNGRLDAGSAEGVLTGVKKLLAQNRVKIILDMSGVEFIDSAGVGILLASYRAVDAKGGTLKICAIQHQVEGILSLTRLGEFFEVFKDRASAEKDFGVSQA